MSVRSRAIVFASLSSLTKGRGTTQFVAENRPHRLEGGLHLAWEGRLALGERPTLDACNSIAAFSRPLNTSKTNSPPSIGYPRQASWLQFQTRRQARERPARPGSWNRSGRGIRLHRSPTVRENRGFGTSAIVGRPLPRSDRRPCEPSVAAKFMSRPIYVITNRARTQPANHRIEDLQRVGIQKDCR